ncbi:bifunctional phosphoglucose/phosphomannose isomerase [Taibaiella sp. KBW10]|uniref:bifunctional phosphoglucose/phosphomannose isomerase n=1 Tax=Taibaiella sp. KBW10 TaxID=2153357 RepID=UPI000F599139|nr:bifunctional phosphoglucose/phosphomannose isomerase [Taibaiella sp. KBW10]RQO31919.1 bifunctional phosphoglucose/phosphomannose isomerase [Taibaiella sp. KBW10]
MSEYRVMNEYIQEFPEHITEGLNIGRHYQFKHQATNIRNVVLAGLGGSGIGAEIVANYIDKQLKVPVVICKDYFLPGFVDEYTLVIACSYSGNTEETMMALEEANAKNARIVCITSGGKIAAYANDHNMDLLQIPSGMPPRACIGYSFIQILFVLAHYEIIGRDFEQELEETVTFLNAQHSDIKTLALEITQQIGDKMPVIYVDQHIAGIGTRWRQQFNENSKILGWERVIPEMNHNELVGWKDQSEHLAVLFLHTGNEYERIVKRFTINKNIVSQYTATVIDVYAKGETYFEKAMYLVLLGDWISWYLAEQRNVDAVEVAVIDYLKKSLCE